jgi:hypothetical protein
VPDEQSLAVVESVVSREGRSLIQYVIESYPWTTEQEQQALSDLQSIGSEERGALAPFVQYLVQHKRLGPQPNPYPVSFTSMNFISLEHLLPILADNAREAANQLDRDLATVSDAGARELLIQYAALKRQHAETLKNLAVAYPETASTRR